MSAIPGYTAVPIKQFKGLLKLLDRSSVPSSFAVDCLNVEYIPGGFRSRAGTVQKFDMGGSPTITDVFHFEILLASNRYYLELINGPALYYSRDEAAKVALLTTGLTGVNHFRQAAYEDRVIFTFSNSALGQTAPYVWTSLGVNDYFDPVTIAAPAVGSFAAADSAVAGVITAGVHKLVVIYETRSGFQTLPSAEISVTAAGSLKLDLTGIPVGGTGVTKRHIGMTEANGATFFLADTIENNTATTLTLNLADATLNQQTELSDWFQFTSVFPSVMGAIQYNDRMVYWGDAANASQLWISEKGLPTTLRSDVGFLPINKEDGDRITNCFVLGSVLYIVKTRGLYAVIDNGEDPYLWAPPAKKCSWMGTLSPSGVAITSDKQEAFILDVKGVYSFTGGDPVLLSGGIESTQDDAAPFFDEINYAAMTRAECHVDSLKKRVYAWVPVYPATVPDRLWMCDYREGIGKAKWCPWETAGTAWRSMAIDSAEVLIAEAGPKVVRISDGSNDSAERSVVHADRGTAIEWYYEPGVLQLRQDGVQAIGGLLIDGTGAGTLNLTIKDLDGTTLSTPTGFTLVATATRDHFRWLNHRSERFFVRVGQNDAAAYAEIGTVIAYLQPSGVRGF